MRSSSDQPRRIRTPKALFAELDSERTARNGELREILADLVACSDLVAFKESIGPLGPQGRALRRLRPHRRPLARGARAARRGGLRRGRRAARGRAPDPGDSRRRGRQLHSVDAFLARSGGSRGQRAPSPAQTAYVLSLFWSTDDAGEWPLMWENAPTCSSGSAGSSAAFQPRRALRRLRRTCARPCVPTTRATPPASSGASRRPRPSSASLPRPSTCASRQRSSPRSSVPRPGTPARSTRTVPRISPASCEVRPTTSPTASSSVSRPRRGSTSRRRRSLSSSTRWTTPPTAPTSMPRGSSSVARAPPASGSG